MHHYIYFIFHHLCFIVIYFISFTESTDCPTDCKSIPLSLTCGSDGNVYKSECDLLRANCGKNITAVDWILCQSNDALCPGFCLKIYDPVCGDDGKIYANKCIMKIKNCKRQINERSMLYCALVQRSARKYNSCPEFCLDIYRPVCGSDAKIYINECYMKKENCGKSINAIGFENCAEVPLCPERCIPLPDPVCGSDGKVYLNRCQMYKKNCGNTSIKETSIEYCFHNKTIETEYK